MVHYRGLVRKHSFLVNESGVRSVVFRIHGIQAIAQPPLFTRRKEISLNDLTGVTGMCHNGTNNN